MARSSGQTVTIGDRSLRLTHPEKVLYPATGTTKAEVIAYYVEIAPFLLPHVAGRTATRKRWPDGVDGEPFFEKNLPDSAPAWIRRVSVQHKSGRNVYPVIDDAAVLAWLGQQAALELHVPQWRVDGHGDVQNPDRFVLDLDPGPGAGMPQCVEVAHVAHDLLGDLGLETFPVTSGSKGLHLYAGLDGSHDAEYVNAFAKQVAQALEGELPELVVSTQKKTERRGKVLADWSQNNRNKTTIAPYSLRGREHPTVAVPRTWDELDDPDLGHLELDEVLERVRADHFVDPMASLGREVGGAAGASSGTGPEPDRLTIYRQKRDAAKTPEPVPATATSSEGGNVFVVQEHHASRLHYDVRLERDGVLVSWAVPKGIPETTSKNHLAVPTEDHPLEYADFEGTIPKGEYGAGEMTIWDRGTYATEKWRDDEVIVVLQGAPDGGLGGEPVRIALLKTGENWLCHRMKDQGHARPSSSSKEFRSPKPSGPGRYPPAQPAEMASRPGGAAFVEPMLAKAGDAMDLDDEADWAFEMKWDGVRILAACDGASVGLRSRSGKDATDTYPEVVEALASLDLPDALLDGEVVALAAGGAPSFSLLQERMHLTDAAKVRAARRNVPVLFHVFDLVRYDGHGLANLRYDQRRETLLDLELDEGPVSVPPAFDGSLDDAVAESRRLGLEGVIAKRRTSRYVAGQRSSSWTKLKHERMQEVVVVGWRPGQGERSGRIGSLLVAVQGDDGLEYAGRVGTGFNDRDLDRLGSAVGRLARKTPPVETPTDVAKDAQWVTPQLVGEVTFGEWTPSGHLRHPVWRGLRSDKTHSPE